MLLSLLRQVILLIPLAIILPRFLSLNGVWIAGPTSDFISSITTFIVIALEMKILNKLGKDNNDDLNEDKLIV